MQISKCFVQQSGENKEQGYTEEYDERRNEDVMNPYTVSRPSTRWHRDSNYSRNLGNPQPIRTSRPTDGLTRLADVCSREVLRANLPFFNATIHLLNAVRPVNLAVVQFFNVKAHDKNM